MKPNQSHCDDRICRVAPRAGAWIETLTSKARRRLPKSRPPRGGVD